jgi:hypothetical protein
LHRSTAGVRQDNCVDVAFDYKIVPPLAKVDALAKLTLARFRPFTRAQGTNFLLKDSEIATELDGILKDRLIPIAPKQNRDPHGEDFQELLDTAIKRATRSVQDKLRNHIVQMDWFGFEWLVRALLLKLGYKNVNVTKQSGDAGIDITAILVAGGIANMKTCIQVKRQKSVGRPDVQNLRGALGAHEAGLFVASGYFTDEAIQEAREPTKVPITLIDGSRLTQLLLQHEIGVRHNKVTLYSLKIADLSQEELEARVEEGDAGEPELE